MESIVVGMFDDTDDALAFANDLESRGVPREAIDIEGGRSDQPKEERSFFQRMGDILTGHDRGALSEGVKRGGTVVSARVDDPHVDETVYLMKAHGAVDIDERAAGWGNPSGPAGAPPSPQSALQGEQHIPVVEEELKVGKRVVEKGGVRVYTQVQQRPVEEQVELRQERVVVERRPVDRAAPTDPALFREGSIDLHERSEELVVGKEARIVEEVVIGKEVQQHVETVRDTVRRTDVTVENLSGSTGDSDRYGADFQEHYSRQYASTGQPFDMYAPAYQYGRQLGSTDAYRGRQWNEVRQDARQGWESNHPGTWDRFEDAIRFAWNRMSGSANTSSMRERP